MPTQLLTCSAGPIRPGPRAGLIAFETRSPRTAGQGQAARSTIQYNPNSPSELAGLAPGFDWNAYLAGAGLAGTSELIVGQPDAFTRLAATFAATPLETLQGVDGVQGRRQRGALSAAAVRRRALRVPRQELLGAGQDPRAGSGRCTRSPAATTGPNRSSVSARSAGASASSTRERYFPPSRQGRRSRSWSRRQGRLSARGSRSSTGWARRPAGGAQEARHLHHQGRLSRPPARLLQARHPRRRPAGRRRRAGAVDWQFYVDRLNGPVDRADWGMTPQTNDAYNGSLRDIVFPAGILQPPIFDPNADPAVNYGAAAASSATN